MIELKTFLRNLGILSLICFSFIYTEKAVHVVKDFDDLMVTIKQRASMFEVKPLDAVIDNNTFIPGRNGVEVDFDKSYYNMKRYGSFDEHLLIMKQVSPSESLKKNYDKYIVKGNKEKKQVTLLFLVNEKDDIHPFVDLLKENKIGANFFIDGAWLEQNNELALSLIKDGYTVGNLSYHRNYKDSSFVWMDTILRKVGKQQTGYCYNEVEDEEALKICTLHKNYTIRPNIIVKDKPLSTIKSQISSGSIISLPISEEVEKELPLIIKYIQNKGYQMVPLDVLLDEERT